MVQCMETWFIAHRAALRKVFRRKLREKSLPRNQKVETVAKPDVLKALKKATSGEYEKGSHAPQILTQLDPKVVRAAAEHCGPFSTSSPDTSADSPIL